MQSHARAAALDCPGALLTTHPVGCLLARVRLPLAAARIARQ